MIESVTQGSAKHVVLTGVTGFIGKVTLEELVQRRAALGIERIHVLIRARGGLSARERFDAEVRTSRAFSRLDPGWDACVSVIEGDITKPFCDLGDVDRERLEHMATHIVHVAASIDFNLPIAEAMAVNTNGALHVLELARSVRRLERLVVVSTAYATAHPGNEMPVLEQLAPLHRPAEELHAEILSGAADERELLRENGHPNTYTFTKCLAELLLSERRGDVPLTIVRPSIVSAAWRTPFPGWIDSRAAYGGFVLLVGGGFVRAFPAIPESKVDIVPVDIVADRVLRAAFDDPNAGPFAIRHAVAGPDHSVTTGDCKDHVVGFFRRHPFAMWPDVPYYGKKGVRYRLEYWWKHSMRITAASFVPGRGWRRGRRLLKRIRDFNRLFPHFTHHQYDFLASELDAHDRPEPTAYLELINQGVHDHLLRRSDTDVAFAGRHGPDHGGDRAFVRRRRDAGFFVRCAAWLVMKALRRCADLVSFDLASFERARREVPPGATMVLAPSHRSYLDFVLCSLLCFARPDIGISMPHNAAAAEFARIPLLGRLLRRLDAFYVERGRGSADDALTERVGELVRRGETIEFFMEGSRSRTRAFLQPRRGFLRALQASERDVTLVPIAVSYDDVPESASFTRELQGHPKPRMRLASLLWWSVKLALGRVNIGRVHLAAGEPVQLKRDGDVREAANAVMAQLQEHTTVTGYHLRALRDRSPGLRLDVDELAAAIRDRGGTVLESEFADRDAPNSHIRDTLCLQAGTWLYPDARMLHGDHPVVARHLLRHDFRRAEPSTASAADPDVDRYLRAVFEPMCDEYVGVIDALRELADDAPLPKPTELVRSRHDATLQLVNVEDAYAELESRGVLAIDGRDWTWGPLRGELAACRDAFAWVDVPAAVPLPKIGLTHADRL